MKKIKLLVFIAALLFGIAIASIFSVGKVFGSVFSISFGKIEGSGVLKNEKRNVADFSNVDVSGAINVEIVSQQGFGIDVETDDNLLDYVKTEVKGDTLKVYTKKWLSPKNKIIVKIAMPEISELEVSGASNVNLLAVKNEDLKLSLSGASKVLVEGETQNFVIDTSGASKINAENLKAENVNIDSSGASKIDVFVTNELKVDASGASKITYAGEPKNIQKDTSGASSIKSR